MSCTINLPFTGTAETIVSKAKSAVEGQGGTFTGDNQAGSFSLSAMGSNIAGSYTVEGNMLNLLVTDKPFFVSCGMIESLLKSKLG